MTAVPCAAWATRKADKPELSAMQAERGQLLAAWVLHRRAYRDTSLIAELFTADQGRVGVVARGARGARSRWRGLLEPFQPLLAAWRGRGELQSLSAAEPAGPALHLPGRRLASGFYLNEVLLRLLRRHDPAPGLFAAYGNALEQLARAELVEAAVLRVFERELMRELGYELELRHAADTGDPVDPQRRYHFEPGLGPLPAQEGSGPGTVTGAALLALAAGQWTAEEQPLLDEAGQLMKRVLAPHLGDRPLHSRQFYRQMRQQGDRHE